MTIDLLKGALFVGLTPEQLEHLGAVVRPVRFAGGEQIFGQGDEAECVYVLEHGEVALQLNPDDGGCMTIAVIRPAEVFGWSAALGRARYTSSAVCLQDAEGLKLRGDDLRALVQADPALGRLLLGRMALQVAGRTADDHAHVARLIQHEMDRTDQ
jgi:CRP-like cAMP-binding protein